MWWIVIAVLAVACVALLARGPMAELRRRRRDQAQERKREARRQRRTDQARRREERAMNPARAAARKGPPRWQQVAARQGAKCWLCGTRTHADDRLRVDVGIERLGATYPTVDYVVPIERGGTYEIGNARIAHRHCEALRQADGSREAYGSPRRTFPAPRP